MKWICFIALLFCTVCAASGRAQQQKGKPEQTIFAFGGDINVKLVQYVVDLTDKSSPKICFIPTASADNPDNIKYWEFICKQLSIEPYVLKVWVSSDKNAKSFEDILLGMDAIVVGGGNTLNMMAIWREQGIDAALKKALGRGIILAGGSAGSICWFQTGISDSRPVNLSVVEGLSFLHYSNCPHYADSLRRAMYHGRIKDKKISAGYAMDDLSGILFKNGEKVEAVSVNDINDSYYVYLKNGKIHYEKLGARILVKKDALPASSYDVMDVNKRVEEYPEFDAQDTPLNAYVSLKYILAKGQTSKLKELSCKSLQERLGESADIEVDKERRDNLLSNKIEKILIYNDSLACVINEYKDFYGLWYFYKENGRWLSAGEDIGGDTVLESEITFREKAKIHIGKIGK